MNNDKRTTGFWLLALFFAAFRAVPLRPDAGHLRAELPGAGGRADLPDCAACRCTGSTSWGGPGRGRHRRRASSVRLALGLAVMVLTVLLSVLAGLAFRKKLAGGNTLFYVAVASLIMPSIIVSLGIGLEFRLIDNGLKWALEALGMTGTLEEFRHVAGPVHLGAGRAPDLDAAVRPADHVRGVQPLQPGL